MATGDPKEALKAQGLWDYANDCPADMAPRTEGPSHRSLVLEGGPYHGRLSPRLAVDSEGLPPPWLHLVPAIPSTIPRLDPAAWAQVMDNVAVYQRQQRTNANGRFTYWVYVFYDATETPTGHPIVNEGNAG